MRFEAPAVAPTVLVAAAGRAEGSRAAAAALACAGAGVDRATLLVDLGGRSPRPTLVASEAARRLEERLAAHLPDARVAARGRVCWLVAQASADGLAAAVAALAVARDALGVVHAQPELVHETLATGASLRLSAVLLRADLAADRALVALAARDLRERALRVAVLKQPLGWVVSRRALFGALPGGSPAGLPPRLLDRLGVSHECYGEQDDAKAESARAEERKRGDHAGAGSR
jgi:hypothetical protein